MEDLLVRTYCKRWRLFGMERAETDVIFSGLFQAHNFRYYLNYIGTISNF